ncbi:MAG: pilus assembly PilX N-terminal domain-containing protein [Candidatus Moranbacteria bacterium]|nr:pilus assembly PilX N-terminal domain-containing protein [Candidatus Moranbacteria bacterium]MBP9801650.1 pilus assembly PilX N-terminal domain-containing protein [Candidatus Moranbacteria bacterium]
MLKILKPNRGSVLVFSLIVLSILLSAAVTVATVSVSNRGSTLSTDNSNQSFQVANSGVEIVLRQIYKVTPTHADINALATALGGGAACASGIVTQTGVAGGSIRVFFYDKDDNVIDCTDTNWRGKVVGIKSEGTASGTTRLVETAVAAASDYAWVGIHTGGTIYYRSVTAPRGGWYRYTSGNHSPTKVCTDAGFLYATGACKVHDLIGGYTVESTYSYWLHDELGSSGIDCEYSIGWSDADPSSMKILCAK